MWARIAVDDDDGDFEARQRDRDDFLGWKTLLEVMPHDDAERNDVVRGVTLLMNALVEHGLRALAQADYADESPGGGAIPPDNGEPTALGWRCPRCGWHNIDEQHTDGTGFGRHVDLQCEACGLVASFDAGAPDAAAWRG